MLADCAAHLFSVSEIFEKTDYSVDDLNQATGRPIALSDDKVALLSGRMRMASLSLHGIQGAFDGPGSKTVIPATVIGKFSIRFVCLIYCHDRN